MESLAQEAIRRVKLLSDEARKIAQWYERNTDKFYRHLDCPDVAEDQPLSIQQAASAIGINADRNDYCVGELRRLGVSFVDGGNTLASLNKFIVSKMPVEFPWFDRERDLKFSGALFSLRAKQLRPDMRPSPVILWQPTANTVNDDLASVLKNENYVRPSIFDRHGFNNDRTSPLKMTSHQFRHLLNTMAQRGGMTQSEIARWSGRIDVKQNRAYDHMSEFELVAMLRSHDPSLTLDKPLEEIATQIAAKLPMTRQEFNMLTMPTAHVTEFGFCVHDFTMAPCQRFRDCLNCTEQVCVKGDRRLTRIKERYVDVKRLKEQAELEINEGTAGADRWYEIHALTEIRVKELIEILENPMIQDGAVVKLRNVNEFSPLRRAIEAKVDSIKSSDKERPLIEEMRKLLGGGLG